MEIIKVIAVFFIASTVVLLLPSLLISRRRQPDIILVNIFRILFGILLPLSFFVYSMGFSPDWKGESHNGWPDVLHYTKIVLLPFIIWAMVAFYALSIWGVTNIYRHWIMVGVFLGALVNAAWFLHALLIIDEFSSESITTLFLIIPPYVCCWCLLKTLFFMRSGKFTILHATYALLGSAPFWIYTVIFARNEYLQLSDTKPECFIVTAASTGHTQLIGPFVTVTRRGQPRRINLQLYRFWSFEHKWRQHFPRSHRCFRVVYNRTGPLVSRYIRNPWLADLTYILLKPAEWFVCLFLTQRKSDMPNHNE